jgi:hypothetical protein
MGRAIRVDYRPGNKYIGGIVYRRYGLISRRALLPLSGGRTMSKRVILADAAGGGREAAVSAEPPGSIYLTDGRYLGELHSLMIDDNTGLVEALIVRTSLLDDIRRGFLWLSEPIETGSRRQSYHSAYMKPRKGCERIELGYQGMVLAASSEWRLRHDHQPDRTIAGKDDDEKGKKHGPPLPQADRGRSILTRRFGGPPS